MGQMSRGGINHNSDFWGRRAGFKNIQTEILWLRKMSIRN